MRQRLACFASKWPWTGAFTPCWIALLLKNSCFFVPPHRGPMPLARIITDSVDDSLELSMQLRARGFRVETVTPDQIPDTPADLEVRLEECAPEEVLTKAAHVKESEDLWVFVAPGALDDRARPMRTIPLVPQVMEAPAAPVPALRADRQSTVEIPREMPEDDFILSELVAARPEETPHGAPQPAILATPAEANSDALHSGSATLLSPPTVAPLIPAPPTPAPLPSNKVKVVVLPKLPEPPQIPDVPQRAQPVNLVSATVPPLARRRSVGPYKIAFRTGPLFWKRAAVSAVLVVMVGLLAAVVGLRPRLPAAGKPTTASPAASPAAPPSRAPQVSRSPATPSPAPAVAKAPPKTSVAPAPPKPAPVTAKAPPKVEPPRRRASSSDDGMVAEDTVVFYDRKPVPSTAKAPPRADVKRNSDEN